VQGRNEFVSLLGREMFGSTTEFFGVQFHFHAKSEHTIDGKRFDLEMHTVHKAHDVEHEFKFAAMGILFSVDEYTVELSWAE